MLFIPVYSPCVCVSETQCPAPFLPLDWPSTFVLLEAAPGSLMKAMFFQGLGAWGAESLINDCKISLLHPLQRTEASHIYSSRVPF